MARRLLSGWLIALAALARSLALMFERAAADRSEPASDPDPVMAELAARYPGAPAHWLAHVAEGMARTTETGEVPLSLTSDAMAWPPLRPTMAPASHEGSAPEPEAESQPVSGSPPRSMSPPPVRRAVEAVPSLAALQSRSSEVWRRPVAASRRPSRPVFAPPVDPVPPRTAPEGVAPATAHRPRPRPTMAVRSPSQARPDMLQPSAPAVETARREPVPSLAARPAPEGPPAMRSEPEARQGTVDAPPQARAVPAFRSVVAPPSIATAFEPPVGAAPRPATRPEAEHPAAIDADHARRPAPSLARRVRRAIFRALAVFGGKSRADRHQGSTRPGLQLVSEKPTREGTREGSRWPMNPPLRAVLPAVAEPDVAPRRTVPPIRTAAGPRAASRRPRLVWSQAPSQVEAARQASPPTVDDRWPAFPPKTFSPPPMAELPAPRLEQLAREQEEGRWSV